MLGPRASGVLLHVTSLPTPFGIGDLGTSAFQWVDLLAAAQQRWWQVLPLGPPGLGNSPYQCYSAFAGSPLLISPERLVENGLLTQSEMNVARQGPGPVQYARVACAKDRLLRLAYAQFDSQRSHPLAAAFDAYQATHEDWLADYALFAALQETHGHADWTRWPTPIAHRRPGALAVARTELRDVIRRHAFWQFLFHRQLLRLRDHARSRNVGLIGDLPIFVSAHSADVWANPQLFELDRNRQPRAVAGVPPDLFSVTGQRWGNPLYDWRRMRQDNFAWWRKRFTLTLAQCDLVRLDHFRGFEACWRIPAACPTAVDGKWVRGPGAALLEALRDEAGGLPVIAEDLGVITPAVERLRDSFGLPGMRILQFGFGSGGANPHLPHNFTTHCVAYTGTHDNDTSQGWSRSATPKERQHLRYYVGGPCTAAQTLVRLAWNSVATIAITPVQDLLSLRSSARMNTPGVDLGNWRWRLPNFAAIEPALRWLADLTVQSGRS